MRLLCTLKPEKTILFPCEDSLWILESWEAVNFCTTLRKVRHVYERKLASVFHDELSVHIHKKFKCKTEH